MQQVELTDPAALQRLANLLDFTQEMDLELLKHIDNELVLRKAKIEDVSAKMVHIEKSTLRDDSSLKDVDERTI